ncbi:hypothetical protein NM688_g473 [Phlebia brevispora]|uniref:Uncharacterized protein n=1 Tax=Phlebia brevispora TaxID=194682 RepID=A0ACC1TEG4_9APHY|nr:hypothetical protein NM688_g473 [Phlebia brevispora]
MDSPPERDELGLCRPELFLTHRNGTQFRCKVCPNMPFMSLSRARRHEDTDMHVQAVRTLDSWGDADDSWSESDDQEAFGVPPRSCAASSDLVVHQSSTEDLWLDHILDEQTDGPNLGIHGPTLPGDTEDQIYDDFGGALEASRHYGESDEELDPIQAMEEDIEWERDLKSDGPIETSSDAPLMSEGDLLKLPSSDDKPIGEDWWPWNDKKEALLDILGAFPRSMFSETELEVTRWFAENLGITNLPSVKQVKDHRERILAVAGAAPKVIRSELGNLYAHNSIKVLLEHEFANPLVRRSLQTYPEDTEPRLKEAAQAERWRCEVDSSLSAPMVRDHNGKDYFVDEPCLVELSEDRDPCYVATAVVPVRWFRRSGELWAKAHRLLPDVDPDGFVVDGRQGSCIDIPLSAFFLNVLDLEDSDTQRRYHLPPARIISINASDDARIPVRAWPCPPRNPWREKAKGKRVLSVPIWLYCDDTSGNTSKKWNKHNSILFTLAGLPQDLVHMLYNIHFIATSNIASPLEMMEYVRAVLTELRQEGLEVWDSHFREHVLLIVWALAFEGDNPMASEIANHVGMSGTMFCRICHGKGLDASRRREGDAGLTAWLNDFLTIGSLRNREETVEVLKTQLAKALGGAPSAVGEISTATGIKDKYFAHFIARLQDAATKFRESKKGAMQQEENVQEALANMRAMFPENIFSPTLGIPDFDAHTDSPVEILHVVLLGVVKYWWRDAVSRLNSSQKDELKTRLSSLDVSGLNTARLRGTTLVQYAGSLVGRDFRIILQVAPSVLHGLIPQVHYQAWLALCRLAPQLFQPEIDDLETYLTDLEDAILQFLAATALWNIQWFNKIKFHLFLHLPYHIRRFGPAILYATESFESYNFVIRLRSIHSSKHAPSIDIANAFSHVHAVRHLVSGGYVNRDPDGSPVSRRQAGASVLDLIKDNRFRSFMSMSGLDAASDSGCYAPLYHRAHCEWQDTLASKSSKMIIEVPAHAQILVCRSLVLQNGDILQPQSYTIYHCRSTNSPLVGRVEEILVEYTRNRLLGVLLSQCEIDQTLREPYNLPQCRIQVDLNGQAKHILVPFEDLLCVVNTFHNCVDNHCETTSTAAVIQERIQTGQFENEITHQNNPMDRLLNTAQLRSAQHIRRFATAYRYPGLSLPNAIEQAIANKHTLDVEAEQAKQAQTAKKEARAASKAKRAATRRQPQEGMSRAPQTAETSSSRVVPRKRKRLDPTVE